MVVVMLVLALHGAWGTAAGAAAQENSKNDWKKVAHTQEQLDEERPKGSIRIVDGWHEFEAITFPFPKWEKHLSNLAVRYRVQVPPESGLNLKTS